MSNDESVI